MNLLTHTLQHRPWQYWLADCRFCMHFVSIISGSVTAAIIIIFTTNYNNFHNIKKRQFKDKIQKKSIIQDINTHFSTTKALMTYVIIYREHLIESMKNAQLWFFTNMFCLVSLFFHNPDPGTILKTIIKIRLILITFILHSHSSTHYRYNTKKIMFSLFCALCGFSF